MICCSFQCEKCNKCGRYIYNLSAKYRIGTHTVEPLDSFGWCKISNEGCESHTYCGFNGNYAMYEPIIFEVEE